MRLKVIIAVVLLLCLLSANQSSAYELDYKEMVAKYGPVPDAILNPPVDEDIAKDRGSLLSRIFGSSTPRAEARTKACYANQRVCLGAIEMYNMDHSTMYTNLDYNDVADPGGMLITTKYLKSPLTGPVTACRLRSYGDLSDTGIIYCEYHGCLPDDRDGLRTASGYTPKPRTAAATDNTMFFVFLALGALSIGVMVVLHNVLPKAPNS